MRRVLLFISVILMFCLGCVSCSDNLQDESTTTTITTEGVEELLSTTETTTETTTEKQTEKQTDSKTDKNISSATITTTTKKSQSNSLISDEDLDKIENSNAEVYFTDDPNNKFIIAVSDKYGSPKENLVALVKVNAEFPSATVLEFSGKTDKNGELLMTYDEFKYIYEINEEKNTIAKASKNGLNNDGANFLEAKILVTLAKEYFIPELPNLKANKRLP